MVSRHQLFNGIKIIFTVLGIITVSSLIWLRLSGGKMLSVQSGSMVPAITKGSLVIVNPVSVRDIAVGDVITFVSADKTSTITHRVEALLADDPNGNKFVTKGDANADPDTPIEAASVVGRVEHSIPYVGYAIDFVRHPIGLLLLIYFPALFIIIHETRRLINYYRRMRPYVLLGYTHGLGSKTGKRPLLAPVLVALVLGVVAFTSGSALAAIQNGALLTGNTISINADDTPEPPEPPPTDTTICTNTNNVDANSTTKQSAQSGDAEVSGNTNGGSAQSGSASNSSSTSIDVNISNSCPSLAQ